MVKDNIVLTVFAHYIKTHKSMSNPTLEAFYADGWQDYIAPAPEPYIPTIEELVEQKLRERYSINQEFEVNRKRDTDQEAFSAYYAYVEECIEWAHQQIDESNELHFVRLEKDDDAER